MTVLERHVLNADTQATLLLCGRFDRQEQMAPLKLSEYNQLAQWLVNQALHPADLLDEGWRAIARQKGFPLDVERVAALLLRGAALAFAVESWTSKGLWVIGRGDEEYPRPLRSRLGRLAPPILYGVGPVELATRCGLAIVGSRDADEPALAFTRGVAATCAHQGMQVVSGGARGVDSEAMGAALDAGGTVVGVLADSLARQAVSSRYRRAIVDERLVLLSATDPNSGFNAGNAMARNKYIYALATWGLVVSSSLGEGGTWTGAVEELNAKRVPLFVRMQEPIPPAHQKLVDLGARPFPDEPWDALAEILASATEAQPATPFPPTQSQAPPPIEAQLSAEPLNVGARHRQDGHPSTPPAEIPSNEQAGATGTVTSVYDAVLPLLLSHLAEPSDVETVAASLEVQKGQLQAWLNRAVAEGMVEKLQRPVRYRTSRQPRLPLGVADKAS